jgi:hypothetical protein
MRVVYLDELSHLLPDEFSAKFLTLYKHGNPEPRRVTPIKNFLFPLFHPSPPIETPRRSFPRS